MSSRQLRKLQQQRELEKQAHIQAQIQAQEEEEQEESDEEPQRVQSKPSLFASLAALEEDDGFKDVDEDEEQEEGELSEPAPAATTKKPKKSKKKKKAKNKEKGKDSAKTVQDTPKNGLDEIDEALKELNLKQTNVANTTSTVEVDEEYERICFLLGINTQHLKVANEMRSLFGRAATENHEDPGGPTGRGARRRQRIQQMDLETALKGHHKPGKGLSELTLRRNCFMQGKDEWPKSSSGGLTMAVVDNQEVVDGTVEYRFVHDGTYQVVQQTFQALVEMGDPQNLIGFIQRNPYHISLLLQVSKIAKDQGDHSLSSDLIERALFTFGRVSLSSFGTKLAKGKARLDFARPENREFWLAGYHYIKSLMMKGTYRTAFEWAKLLLSLDPEDDPYCMRWMIHHLALRAHEFQWLLDFAASRNVPEWANTINYAEPSFALAAQQLKDGAKCRSILSDSMGQVPWLFCRLFKELDLDAPPSIWGMEPPTASDTFFTELYVLQAKDLWNTPESTALLVEVAETIEKPDLSQTPLLSDLKEMSLDIVRFVYLDNRRELMSLVPSNLLHRSNNSDSDPLPPYNSIISYKAQERNLETREEIEPDEFNDPLAALARLFPGFPGLEAFRGRGADDDSIDGGDDAETEAEAFERLRDHLGEEIQAEDDGEVGEDEQPRGPISLSNATRILNSLMFWRAPAYADPSESGSSDTDDDSMPELIDSNEGEQQSESRQAHVEDAEDEDIA
ncbi:hypothetical protein MFRU_026g00390 [Monilinia fructicola]|uniref:Transcription factor 25 n=1 Tax=Monilinia fructicola TaxID=38448 RepID=A0A5M9JU88_MONFR|nr:hypothetical protein EYC84_001429 [Monilinia fructicola]KAG4027857.1 hypothetical protein MFRU_026g00390 [Monilinia fructicola]